MPKALFAAAHSGETNRKWTVIALLCAVFLAAMEATAVATVMPTIVGDLGGLDRYSWVFTAYMMFSTITVPIYGKLADLYGRKPILQLGIGFFLVGSVCSAFSRSMNMLILFRALQGLGAGAIQPMGITITADIFKIEERAKITAVFGTVWGVAGISGPLIGSIIVEFLGWPWIYLVNIPFGLASAWIVQKALHENVVKKKVKLDWLGAIFLSAAISCTLLAVNNRADSIILVPLSTLCFIAFLLVEQRVEEPIVPLDIFSNPVISNASIVSIMLGGAMLTFVTYLPLYVEGVLQLGIFAAGVSIIPMGLAWPIASGLSARILPRIGFRRLLRTGLVLVFLGCSTTAAAVYFRWPFAFMMSGMGLLGLGMGFSNIPLLFSVQSAVPWNRRGTATATNLFSRTMGGTIAVGVMGAVLARALLLDPTLPASVANQLIGPTHGRNVSPEDLRRLAGVMDYGLTRVFFYSAGIALLALLFGLFFPKVVKEAAPDEDIEGVETL
jgi:EmrB/QacA subfamily drug resistance transporter